MRARRAKLGESCSPTYNTPDASGARPRRALTKALTAYHVTGITIAGATMRGWRVSEVLGGARLVAAVIVLAATFGAAAQGERYKDPRAPVDERVADLLGSMTLEEKVAQLTSVWLGK